MSFQRKADVIVCGDHEVRVAELNPDLVRAEAKELGMVPGDGRHFDLERVVRAVIALYGERHPTADIVPCEHCGAPSPASYPACPFCGSADEVEATAVEAPVVVAPGVTPLDLETVPRTADELARQLERFHATRATLADKFWELGHVARVIHEAELWKLDVDPETKVPRWSSWERFCRGALRMSHGHVFGAMRVARHLTLEDVRRHGTTKMVMMLQLPPDQRAAFMGKVEAGATKEQLREEVRGHRAEPLRQVPSGPAGPTKAPAPVPTSKVTVAIVEGRVELPMHVDPGLKRAKAERRAHRIDEAPLAVERLQNGVVAYYRLVSEPEGLKLVVERRRDP